MILLGGDYNGQFINNAIFNWIGTLPFGDNPFIAIAYFYFFIVLIPMLYFNTR